MHTRETHEEPLKAGDKDPRPELLDTRTCNAYEVNDESPDIVHDTAGTGAGDVGQGHGLGSILGEGT